MASKEAPAGEDPVSQSRNRDPSLQLRLYFRRHMTETVKLFGYGGLSIDDAKERQLPLRKEYGDAPILATIEELVEIDHSRLPHWVNLKSNVLLLARQILGSPPAPMPNREIITSPGLQTLDRAKMTSSPVEIREEVSEPRTALPKASKKPRKRRYE